MKVEKIVEIIEKQNEWRGRKTINLIASENSVSDLVKFALQSDFSNRYAEGTPSFRYYQGTKYIDEIETYVNESFKKILNAKYVEVRSISGTQANDVAFRSLLSPDDTVLVYKVSDGGHISHQNFGSVGRYTKNIINIPTKEDGYFVDVEKTLELLAKYKPKLIILGRSVILFPEPVKEIAKMAEKSGTIVIFDASHIMGMVMSGKVNKPLEEGAHIIAGSTHKTFFGSQRGIVATNDQKLFKKIEKSCFPGAVSNHHLNTLAGLAIALSEFESFGKEYTSQIIKNAKAFAKALESKSIKVLFAKEGYTNTHQVLIDVSEHGNAVELAERLENNNIIVNANMLPKDKSLKNQSGIRMGIQEVTRWGMMEGDMKTVAGLFAKAVIKKQKILDDVTQLRESFPEMKFTFKNKIPTKSLHEFVTKSVEQRT